MKHLSELSKPPDAIEAEEAVEVLRAWIVNQTLQVSLRPTIWTDGSEWGILLADVAQHVADAMAKELGKDFTSTVARIRQRFNDELDAPSSERMGSFIATSEK
jgi:hypothetical protein